MTPWEMTSTANNLVRINLGVNPISKLEVVSLLNVLSQAHYMYVYDGGSLEKHNSKIYLGSTLQTVATTWILDDNYPSTSAPNHDEIQTQKQVF